MITAVSFKQILDNAPQFGAAGYVEYVTDLPRVQRVTDAVMAVSFPTIGRSWTAEEAEHPTETIKRRCREFAELYG